jgi:hypothetical protein
MHDEIIQAGALIVVVIIAARRRGTISSRSSSITSTGQPERPHHKARDDMV